MTVKILESNKSFDGSIKYLFANDKSMKFEGVYFRLPPKKDVSYKQYFVCVSSQAGCAMGCKFCSTGKRGLVGNLTCEEIINQVKLIKQDVLSLGLEEEDFFLTPVLMGMGEPLHNFEETVKFCNDVNKHINNIMEISISTVGISPKIIEIANTAKQLGNIRLSISIHSPYDQERREIIPISKKYPINSIIEACKEYFYVTNNRIKLNYLLLEGVNDSNQHATDFAKLIDNNIFDVQILLYNPSIGEEFRRPSVEKAKFFSDILETKGINVVIRNSLGRDIGGGCGQLANK